MKKGLFLVAVVFAIVFVVDPAPFAMAANVVRIQGRVMGVDSNSKMMIVNERTFVWDESTKFYNEKSSPITADGLRPQTWAYIEGARDMAKNRVLVNKIYILPKRIPEKEKRFYPFFENTEVDSK